VDAQEQHDRHPVVVLALDPGQSREALAGEALGHEGQEMGDLGPVGELVVAGREEQLDRLHRERARERLAQIRGCRLEGQALIGAERFEVGHGGPPWWDDGRRRNTHHLGDHNRRHSTV
jgi:hypothetical protein